MLNRSRPRPASQSSALRAQLVDGDFRLRCPGRPVSCTAEWVIVRSAIAALRPRRRRHATPSSKCPPDTWMERSWKSTMTVSRARQFGICTTAPMTRCFEIRAGGRRGASAGRRCPDAIVALGGRSPVQKRLAAKNIHRRLAGAGCSFFDLDSRELLRRNDWAQPRSRPFEFSAAERSARPRAFGAARRVVCARCEQACE